MSIKSWLRNWLLESKGEEPPLPLDAAVSRYEACLSALEDGTDAADLLSVLVQRDQVATALGKETSPPAIVQRLVELDRRLRRIAPRNPDSHWDAWRQALNPSSDYWWWRLDEKRDLPLMILAGLFMTITLSLAVDIIQRMWSGGPDTLSVVSAVLTLALTSSPLTKQGRELAGWLMDRIGLPPHLRGETMLGAACLAFIVTLLLRLALPAVAVTCNNRGYALLQAGDLTGAQRAFARAVSINPDYAAGYYNLADAYVEIGDDEQALSLYKQALAAERTLDLAYNGLGYVLILQGKPERAVSVLYTGLSLARDDETRYAIRKNLGWAYYQTDQYDLARDQLETAIAIRSEQAPAYYYLALTYEALEEPEAAITAWENCLRYIDYDDSEESGWAPVARAHLQKLREEI